MKYSLYPETNTSSIPAHIQEIYLVRPVKHEKLLDLEKKIDLKKIFLSESCRKRLPERTKKFFENKGIELIMDQRRGRAIEMDLDKISQVNAMRNDFKSFRKIEQELGIPKSTVHYLVRYADRLKVKKENQVIHLD